jgi:hypothetical protein
MNLKFYSSQLFIALFFVRIYLKKPYIIYEDQVYPGCCLAVIIIAFLAYKFLVMIN